MAKKKPAKKSTKKRAKKAVKRETIPYTAYLLKLIELTDKEITGKGGPLDELFIAQMARLSEQLTAAYIKESPVK